MIEFYGDPGEIERLTKGISLSEKQLKKATVSALNKTITSVRTFIVREVNKEYNVAQKDIRKELKLSKANYSRMEARVMGEGSPGIKLYKFSPTPKAAPSTRRLKSGAYSPKGGIKVMIHRGSRKIVKGAFIARMSSGHVGVFRRKESGIGDWWNAFSGGGIEELYGPSPLRIIDTDYYVDRMDDFTQETMDKNMAHEAEFYMKQAGV